LRSQFEWLATASAIDVGGAIPTTLFGPDTDHNGGVLATINGVDLSALGSGKNLVNSTGQRTSQYNFINCKLGASVTVSGNPSEDAAFTQIIDCDSGATNYRHERWAYQGSQVIETTIVRTGGATDGTTPISWKIVTTANSGPNNPFSSLPMAIWNDTTSANVTVTVYGIWGGGAVPNNDDVWIEVSYMGSASSPIATINAANGLADVLAAGTAQSSDSSTWGGSTTAFKMSVTLSSPQPALKGPPYATVKAAKASSTFYVDPKPVLS